MTSNHFKTISLDAHLDDTLENDKSQSVSETDNTDFDRSEGAGSISPGDNQGLGSDDNDGIFETDQKPRSALASVEEDSVVLDSDQNSTLEDENNAEDSKKKAWQAHCRRNILAKNAVDAFLLEIADQIGDEDNGDVSEESQIQIPSQSFFL